MKQPDRQAVKQDAGKATGADPVIQALVRKAIWINLGIAATILVLFRFLLPMFFSGGGTLTGGNTMASINSNLSSALESGSIYAAGLFLALSLAGWLYSVWLNRH